MLRMRVGFLSLSLQLAGSAITVLPTLGANQQTVPLTSVTLVADLDTPIDTDDPGTGGGFETQAFFQRRLADASAIQACMDPIEHAAATWASGLGLSRSLRQRDPSTLTLHYVKPEVPGLFALNYSIEQQTKARVRVDFIVLDGTQRAPELARELIETFRIASLQDSLDSALRCNGKAS